MNEILKAAKLDFCLVRPYLKGLKMAWVMALFFLFFYRSLLFGITFSMIINTMLIAYPFSISEKNGVERLYGILPVSKKHLVFGRYLFTCAVGLSIVLFTTAVYSAVLAAFRQPLTPLEICLAPVAGFSVFSFYTVIQLPAFYKYGTLKGKSFTYIPMMVYVVLLLIVLNFNVIGEDFLLFIADNVVLIAAALLLLFIMAHWISIAVSIRALQNKEI